MLDHDAARLGEEAVAVALPHDQLVDLGDCPQQTVERGDASLGVFALGDVAIDGKEDLLCVERRCLRGHLDRENGPVAAHVQRLEFQALPPGGRIQQTRDRFRVSGRPEVSDVAPDDLLARASVHRGGGLVGIDNDSVPIHEPDAVARVVAQQRKASLALAKLATMAPSHRAVGAEAERGHRQEQPRDGERALPDAATEAGQRLVLVHLDDEPPTCVRNPPCDAERPHAAVVHVLREHFLTANGGYRGKTRGRQGHPNRQRRGGVVAQRAQELDLVA